MFDSTASEASAKAMGEVQVETLLRANSSWNNVPYRAYPEGRPELTVLKITIPAHGVL